MTSDFQDYYAALGVSKSASPDEVKKAYRRLAREHHPDLHPEKDKAKAAEKFKTVNEAYEVLSNPEKRAKYDRLGPGSDQDGGGPPPPRRPRPAAPDFGNGGDAEAFSGFSDFFRGFGGGEGRAAPRAPRRGQDVEAEMSISLEDAVRGGEKKLTLMVPALCPSCGGSGRRGGGFCPDCGGVGELSREKTITARLPQAVRDGMRLRLRGQGAAAPGGEAGDLFLRLRLLPHPSFKISGGDLETDVTVMPWTAALGGEAEVASLEGPVRIKIPAGTRAGRTFRVAGKGLGKDGGGRGDLLAAVRLDLPEKIDARMEKLLRELGGGAPMSDARLEIWAAQLELEKDFLRLCVQHGVVAVEELPAEASELPADRRARLRRLQRLCRGLDVDVFAGAIIVDLLERMDEMERDLERLRGSR